MKLATLPKVDQGAETAQRIAAALRFLQHEARAASLESVTNALIKAEQTIVKGATIETGATINRPPIEISAAGEPDWIEFLRSKAELSPAERAFHLRAMTEISEILTTDELLGLAFLCTNYPTHLNSLVDMLISDTNTLPQS